MESLLTNLFYLPNSGVIIKGSYSLWFVLLSLMIAIFSSYTALQIASYKKHCSGPWCDRVTILCAGLALGGGVWSMHFIGMLAFHLHTKIEYDVFLTLLSIIPGFLASWLALYFIDAKHNAFLPLLGGGVLVGAGIGAMHYVGMAAMKMELLLRYDLSTFLVSILVAVVFATLSLWVRFYLIDVFYKRRLYVINLIAAVAMGFAISGMHYMGMAAARFIVPRGATFETEANVVPSVLAFGVSVVTLVIIGMVLALVTISKYKAVTIKVKESEGRFRTLVANIPGAAYRRRFHNNTDTLFVSDAIQDITGYEACAFLGDNCQLSFRSLVLDEDLGRLDEINERGDASIEYRIRRADGQIRWIHDHFKVITHDREKLIDGFIMDVTEQVIARKEVDRFKALVDFSEDAIICLSLKGEILSWNDAARKIYGYSESEIIGKPMSILSGLSYKEECECIHGVVQGKRRHHYRTRYHHKNGSSLFVSITASPIMDSDGVVRSISKISRDVTHEVLETERMKKQLDHDQLTGLLSRFGFDTYFENQICQAALNADVLALIFIDLDGFKYFNDTYGHEFGDQILKEVAHKMRIALRGGQGIGRLGGDEFVICIPSIERRELAEKVAFRIIQSLLSINEIDGVPVSITASLGISMYPENGSDMSELLRNSDMAMYEAKRNGKNQVQFFSTEERG
ncbi:sensor domain-containing diguanylate cyclase [Marinomonas communis]|uniref:sensor domain-containing diguanylate cyclase n=1 Tax=Marinomonas communis TaxID=28254 RepID=UPI001D18AD4A|nr:MHYT domain-containing protein [Marinomonas communis]MCC4275901.1 diguanylate cyclase [Marinomonas communis]